MQQRRPQGNTAQPFDQRFLLFAISSMAILMLYQSVFAPPPPVEPAAEAPVAKAEDAADAAIGDRPLALGGAVGQQATAPAESGAAGDGAAAAGAVAGADGGTIEDTPTPESRQLTLGSVDSEGVYRMLLTLNNVGAAIERVELSSERYRDLDNRSGYLGHLALEDAPLGGAVVNVVGAGTPAATAGLRPGDVVVSAEVAAKRGQAAVTSKIGSTQDLLALLDVTKPGRTVELTVQRDGAEQTVSAELRRQPLDLIRPEAENLALHKTKTPAGFKSKPSFVVRLTAVNALRVDSPPLAAANERLAHEAWTLDQTTDEAVVLRKRLPALGLEVVKRFAVVATPADQLDNKAFPSYHFDMSVEVKNLAAEPQRVAYELTGPNGLPIEGYWYANKIGRSFGAYGLRDVIVRFADSPIQQISCSEVADGDVDPMGQGKPLAFVGVDGQYFASILIPQKASLRDVRFAEVRAELATPELGEKARDTWENASCVLASEPQTLAAGGSTNDEFRVFAGPKLPALLAEYKAGDDPGHGLQDVLYYGWFGPVARIMLGILHAFYSVVGNYGIAIILLTVVVRGAMFPISRQQAMNMVKMQQLKPEMDRLAEKYKSDMQKRSQAQQELFRKHNYNPAAGCLPMFLQLPIFLGLYRALAVDVELRQAPLFTDAIRFCSNLAAPDMLYDWSWLMPQWVNTGQGMFGIGPYFNLLPIATICLFLLQQKLFMPEATSDQARMQQQMMKYMMGFMGLLFFKVPSGLCIYFIASSLWGIAERKMLPKPAPAEAAAVVTPVKSLSSNSNKDGDIARAKAKRKNKKQSGKKRK